MTVLDPFFDARVWFACSDLDRPTDAFVAWHYFGCVDCRLRAKSHAIRYPDDSSVAWLNRVLESGSEETR